MTDTSFVGWCITRDIIGTEADENNLPPDEESAVGMGQTLAEANATVDNYNSMMRRIEMVSQLQEEDVRNPIKFRLYDDDDNLYFEGVCSRELLLGEDDLGDLPLKWGEADAGAVMIAHAAADLPGDLVKRHDDIGACREEDGEMWVMIYG